MRKLLSIGVFLSTWVVSHAQPLAEEVWPGVITVAAVDGAVLDAAGESLVRDQLLEDLPAQVALQPESKLALVFSNGLSLYADEGAVFSIKAFEQRAFDPHYADLKREPSRSLLTIQLTKGRLALYSPEPNPTSDFTIETPHGTLKNAGSLASVTVLSDETRVQLLENLERGDSFIGWAQTVRYVPKGGSEDFLQAGQIVRLGLAYEDGYEVRDIGLDQVAITQILLKSAQRAADPLRFIPQDGKLKPVRVLPAKAIEQVVPDNYRLMD